MFISINGEKICPRAEQPNEAFAYFSANGARGNSKDYRQGSGVDFWSWNQTCRVPISYNRVKDTSDDWEMGANRFRRHCKQHLEPNHTYEVTVELCYRIRPTDDNLQKADQLFPLHDTPVSLPLSKGSFKMTVPPTAASGGSLCSVVPPPRSPGILLGDLLPDRANSMPRATIKHLESEVMRYLSNSGEWGCRSSKTEQPIVAVITGEWQVVSSEYFEICAGYLFFFFSFFLFSFFFLSFFFFCVISLFLSLSLSPHYFYMWGGVGWGGGVSLFSFPFKNTYLLLCLTIS